MGLIKLPMAMVLPAMTVALAALAACGGTADTPSPAATVRALDPAATTVPAASPRPTITPAPRQLTVELEGDGPEVLGPFAMGAGVLIAFVRYEGESPFSMTFLGGEKGIVKSIESSPGPYQGERVHSVFEGNNEGLLPGDYKVEIEANGPWRLRMFQERAVRGQSPKISLSGSGDGGGSWLRLDEGHYTMTTSHTGSSGFTVELFDSQGLPPYRIVQAAGEHEGTQQFTVGGGAPGENPQAGFYAMGVSSEGDWEITITNNDAP